MELIACRRCKKMMPNQMANCPSCGIPQKVGGDDMDGFLHYALMPLKKYTDFSERARRKEFWFFFLFQWLVVAVLQVISPVLGAIASIIFFVPMIAVGVRRLHDIDKSGWWVLLWLIPIIGWIILIVWACREGDFGPNRFGSDPKES